MYVQIIAFILLIAVAGFCKAAMDTRTFQKPDRAYQSYPRWFRLWMQRRGDTPIIKIDDGWHFMQAVMFLLTGAAYLIAGAMWAEIGWWALLSIPLRSIVHGMVFEYFYPMH
jgi:hypothetical protein